MRRVWDEVVTRVGQRSKRSAAVVREATVRDVEGDTIVLQFQHGVHATMLANASRPLLDAVHEVVGGTWQLRCEARDVTRTPDPPAAPAPPAPPTPAEPDWPEPARPGGPSAGTAASGGTAAPPPVDDPLAPPEPDPVDDDQVDVDRDERTAAGTSEQQALELLQQTLGAEKIGEVAP